MRRRGDGETDFYLAAAAASGRWETVLAVAGTTRRGNGGRDAKAAAEPHEEAHGQGGSS